MKSSTHSQSVVPISGLFVTGTDTGVGKTFVTAFLLEEMRRLGVNAAGFKPIACGAGGRADARRFASLMKSEVSLDLVNPIYLRKPLAPMVAAKLEKRRMDWGKISTAYQSLIANYPFILVEGAGGWLVPIAKNYFVREMAQDFKLPVLVVARPKLGTLNHTLLTVESIRAAKLTVAAIVLNATTAARRGLAERTNAKTLRELTGLPVVDLPYQGSRVSLQNLIRVLRPWVHASVTHPARQKGEKLL